MVLFVLGLFVLVVTLLLWILSSLRDEAWEYLLWLRLTNLYDFKVTLLSSVIVYRAILDFILCDLTKSLIRFFWFNDDEIELTLLLSLKFSFSVSYNCFFIYGVIKLWLYLVLLIKLSYLIFLCDPLISAFILIFLRFILSILCEVSLPPFDPNSCEVYLKYGLVFSSLTRNLRFSLLI